MSIIQEQKDLAELRGIVVIIAISSLVFLGALAAVDYAEKRRSKTLEERVNALESAQRCECDLCLWY